LSHPYAIIEHMFESGGGVFGSDEAARCLVYVDDLDAPPLTDAEIAELIAGDPEPWDDSRAEAARQERITAVLAAGQTAPVTDLLIGQLSDLDPDRLDQDQRVALTKCWQRVRNHVDARLGQTVAAVARNAEPVLGTHPLAEATSEIGAALALGAGAAGTLVSTSVLLTDRLPATLAAGLRGDVSWDKAAKLAQRTAALPVELARKVEDRVLPFAPGRTPARHDDAVRRCIERLDPDGADARRKQAKRDVAFLRSHHGDGIGELFARMPSEQVEMIWTAADASARAAKAAGDQRTLDELRIAALVGWAESYLTHGDPTHCEKHCQPPLPTDTDEPGDGQDDDGPDVGPDDLGPDPDGPDDDDEPDDDGPDGGGPTDDQPRGPAPAGGTAVEPVASAGPPRRHGRPVRLGVLWDLPALLGLTRRGGELTDSGATLPLSAMRELIDRGVRVRRMLIHPDHGELLDLTPVSWRLPGRTAPPGHGPPVQLNVLFTETIHRALVTGDSSHLDPQQTHQVEALRAALETADPVLRALVDYPITAHTLDNQPDAETPSPALAEFVTTRDRHPTNPTGGLSAASAGDLDHTLSRTNDGPTTRHNLASLTRRWHVLKTRRRWTYTRHERGWLWTSPTGRTYQTQPYDYRYEI
jgi:hypothetical protein